MAVTIDGISNIDDEIDYTDIEEKYRVEMDDSFDNIVVVDGVPIIDKTKYDRLITKITKEFGKRGANLKPDQIIFPWGGNGKSKGFLFVEFRSADEAAYAIGAMDVFDFDARHKFRLNRFADIEHYAKLDEIYVEIEEEEYAPKEHLRSWLADPQGRDQYVTFRNDDVGIHWHGKASQAQVAYEKRNWTDLYVSWSPLGTYLATLHRQGIRLWGGESWKGVQRFAHPLVKLLDFSPCENYLVTWSNEPIVIPDGAPQGPQFPSPEDEGNSICVWDVKTGNLIRTFPASQPADEGSGNKKVQWPMLKWSPDDKFVARITPGQQISVYELPSMGLHGKKSIKIEGVVDFEWCPLGDKEKEEVDRLAQEAVASKDKTSNKKLKENMLAYWTPEISNQPARVTVMSFPGRAVLRAKNLFNVSDCKLHWQNQGDFLCVKVDRHTKTKKTIFCNLEIFRVTEKDFPVEVVELKDTVLDFSWEPRGERFAIISSNDPNLGNPGPGVTIKTDVSFYQLERGKNDFKLLKLYPNRSTNQIRWAPRGRHVVLATVGSSSKSELEFFDLDFGMEDLSRGAAGREKEDWGSNVQSLGIADHYGVTDVEWDPSGRYLATSASAWRHTIENGYAIWDFRGSELEKQVLDRFKQFLWRPRARTLLSKEQQKSIRKNLREFSRQFEEEDAAELSNVSAELIAHRKRLVDEWNAWRAKCREERAASAAAAAIVGEDEDDEDKEEIQVWVDELIEQVEEVVE